MLFPSEVGTLLSARNVNRNFNKVLKKAGIEKSIEHMADDNGEKRAKSFHICRHTFAVRLLEKSVHMKTLQVLLGHKDYSVTANTYSHVLRETKQKEIEVLNCILSDRKEKAPVQSQEQRENKMCI